MNSAVERVLERELNALSDDAYKRNRSQRADAYVWIEILTACLEWHLVRHECVGADQFVEDDPDYWDSVNGWLCNCLDSEAQ